MNEAESQHVERFPTTAGRVTGVLTLFVGVVLLVIGTVDPDYRFAPWALAAIVLAMVLAWAAMLRPALWVVDEETLVLRGMLDTAHVPLAGIDEVNVRQVLAVRAGRRRFVSAAVGRSRRTITRPASLKDASAESAEQHGRVEYGLFVETRLRELVAAAHRRGGFDPFSEEHDEASARAVRRWDALPLGLLGAACSGLVLALLLG
ncbi:MAG: hypothetical protein ACI379_03125 [Nocardioides sp.]|uniref:hypothetical protein n=1 Tax=Nocardioides sp. TaxID=35761 RepID=UPI003F0E7D26